MELTINAPSQGIAQSPHIGFANVRDLDIYSIPGVVQLNNVLAKESADVIDSTPLWIVKNPASPVNLYALSLNGKIWKSTNSGDTWAELTGQTAGGAGQGAIVWKDYLFIAYGAGIDVYGPLSGTVAWTKAWQALTSDSAYQPMLVSKNDGKLYIGNGRYIASVEENSGQNFAPGTGATYTFTAQALDLPEDYRIKCLAELGTYLMIGTWQGTNIYDLKIADIFPWDRFSPSFYDPIILNENGVNAMITIGSSLYILAGLQGNIYKSNGTNAVQIGQIPQSIVNLTAGKYLVPFPGAITEYKGKIYFGISGDSTSTTIGNCGVYSLYQTAKGNILTLEHTISTTADGSASVVLIGSLLPITRDILTVGWRSAATYGIDRTSISTYGTADTYTAYFDTPLYKIGSNKNLIKLKDMEISFVKELAANESFRVQYRVNLTDSFTTLKTDTYSNLGAVISANYNIDTESDIPPCEYVQFRISLCGTTTTLQLKQLVFKY